MILRQFLHSDPVAISYLFGCGGHAACAVVDPVDDIRLYLRAANETGMRIAFVVDTHTHADHRSAGRALAAEAGAEYVLHSGADVAFARHPVKDGDRLPLGNVVVDVIHTPGHTPEHMCLLVTDRTHADEPWFVVTSHTLMVGDVGRTELTEDAASGARTLFTSLRRLKALSDPIEVLPGAYSGSVCGRRLSGNRLRRSASSGGTTLLSESSPSASSSISCCRTSRPHRSARRRYELGTAGIAPPRLNDLPVVDAATTAPTAKPRIALGLRENWQQFALLVLINGFVGGMVGLERTLVPLIGSETFQLASTVAITSFIISFGTVKAITNLVSGQLADSWGRKKTLVLGWAVGLPVPFLIMFAPSWDWIVAANVLLGINQGLSWSMTVIMKVDLVGPRQRGLAVGLNEFAGYLAVGLTAFLTGYLATIYALRPVPFYLGIGYAAVGLLLSAWVVRDTRGHVALERSQHPRVGSSLKFGGVFLRTSVTDRNLFAASQAGLVNNLNDGMSWGIFPLFFAAAGLGVERIGILKGVYPAIWGTLQVVTGPLSDRWGRKGLIAAGMWVQAVGLFAIAGLNGFGWWLAGSLLLGLGTAMVYPCLLAAVSDAADPAWRARALSVYRFWRDLGYAIGALTAGLLAAIIGFAWTIAAIGVLTFLSGLTVAAAMKEWSR